MKRLLPFFLLALLAALLTAAPASANTDDVETSEVPTVIFNTAYSFQEKNTGANFVRVYFSLTGPAVDIDDTGWGSVRLTFVDDTATVRDRDYRQASRRVVRWGPGVTSRWVDFRIVGDTDFEDDETFIIRLSNPDKVELDETDMVITILNDDPEPVIPVVSFESEDADPADNRLVSFEEGDAGIKTFRVQAKLDVPAPGRVSVFVETDDGLAIAREDYRSKRQRLIFNRGQSVKTFTIQTLGDTDFEESSEDFFVQFADPDGLAIGEVSPGIEDRLRFEILDDDDPPPPAPELTVINGFATVTEGDSGYQNVRIDFELDAPAPRNASLRIDVGNEFADTATPGSDFIRIRNRLVRFRTGATSAFINVRIRGDRVPEDTEIIDVFVGSGQNIFIPGNDESSFITILDND